MADGIHIDPPAEKPPSRRAQQRERRERAQAEGQCTAKAKSTGKRCWQTPAAGRATCRFHGANGGRPIIHGRYSELPDRIRAPYEASLNDPTLLDLTQTIALMDGLVRVHGARLKEGDTPAFRERALVIVEEMIAAKDSQDGSAGRLLQVLIDHLRAGADETRAEETLIVRVERLSRRIEEFQRLKLAKQNVMNAVDLVSTLQRFLEIVARIAPADLAQQIVAEIEALLQVDVSPVEIQRN